MRVGKSAAAALVIGCAALAASLGGCGERKEAAPPSAPAPTTPAPANGLAAPEIFGMYIATSSTAMAVAGDAEIDEAGAGFKHGLTYQTQSLPKIDLEAPAAENDDSLRVVMGIEPDRELEIAEMRRVTSETIAPEAPNAGLCGPSKTTYLALAVSRPEGNAEQDGSQPRAPQYLWVAAFTGEEAPGPAATKSQLCGTFLFLREITT